MPSFRNTSTKPIQVVVFGSRKTVKVNQLIEGPESLGAIPGLTLVETWRKNIINGSYNNGVVSNPMSIQEIRMKSIDPINPEIFSDYSKQIDQEIAYLDHMKSLGENPSLTIAILTKNSFNLISDCCESIFRQVKYKNITLLIADTGTTDNPVRHYYTLLPKKCEERNWKYKFVQLNHYHFGENYNEVVKNHVDTEFVLIQNNDTIALNDYVTEMMGIALQRCVGSTGCRMFYKDGRIQHDGQFLYTGPGRAFNGAGHVHLGQKKETIPANLSYTHMVDGNTAAGVIVRTKEFLDIGGFDTGFKDIFQDVDLMMKIPPLLHKYNYCNRTANIIHYDNASRLAKGPDPKRQAQMMEDTQYLRLKIMENSWHRATDPKPVDFSIITLVYDLESYKDFCNSLRQQYGQFTIEIIAIPNFFNFFKSSFKALNAAQDLCNGKTIIFCHDDIVVNKEWLYKINKNIVELEAQNIDWGVLGPAGVIQNSDVGSYYLLDQDGVPLSDKDSSINTEKSRCEVTTLDELCLITKKSNNLRFSDAQLTGFHFYGGNICLEAQIRGLKNFAIDAYCHHKSDGFKNTSSQDGYAEYERAAKHFNTWAKLRGIPTWRTTTAISQQGKLHLFIKPPMKNG